MKTNPMPWWHGNTVRCDGCEQQFPALDSVCQVVTVQGDPCSWHRGFLDPVTSEDVRAIQNPVSPNKE